MSGDRATEREEEREKPALPYSVSSVSERPLIGVVSPLGCYPPLRQSTRLESSWTNPRHIQPRSCIAILKTSTRSVLPMALSRLAGCCVGPLTRFLQCVRSSGECPKATTMTAKCTRRTSSCSHSLVFRLDKTLKHFQDESPRTSSSSTHTLDGGRKSAVRPISQCRTAAELYPSCSPSRGRSGGDIHSVQVNGWVNCRSFARVGMVELVTGSLEVGPAHLTKEAKLGNHLSFRFP